MKNVIGAAVFLGTAMASGCSSVDAFNEVSNVYSAARSGMAVKSAFTSVKDIKDAQPVFQGYTTVAVMAEVAPRESVPTFAESFRQNMVYLVGESARATGAPLTACHTAVGCGGRVLAVQFREEGFNANLLEKVTMGDRLKGVLSFVDAGTGQILASKRLEGVETYTDLMAMIRTSVGLSMVKSFSASDADMEKHLNAIAEIPAIRPGMESTFKIS